MIKKCVMALMMIFMIVPMSALAETVDVMTIIKKCQKAIDNAQAGSRKVSFTVKDGERITGEWVAKAAYKKFNGEARSLMVIVDPDNLKGTGHVFWKDISNKISQWVYYPTTRRVRSLSKLTIYESFLGTDFTHADIGFQDPGGTYSIIGEEKYAGTKAMKIENIPTETWYYSKIVSWISADNFLPLKRNYYDSTGSLWKTKLIENIVSLNNVPMPLRFRMIDVQRNRSTEILISDVCFDVEYLIKEDFDPQKLPSATLSPVCTVRPASKKK
jgi:outer membrane lipoprotein-sorting protein